MFFLKLGDSISKAINHAVGLVQFDLDVCLNLIHNICLAEDIVCIQKLKDELPDSLFIWCGYCR